MLNFPICTKGLMSTSFPLLAGQTEQTQSWFLVKQARKGQGKGNQEADVSESACSRGWRLWTMRWAGRARPDFKRRIQNGKGELWRAEGVQDEE